MTIQTVTELKESSKGLLKSTSPVLVTRRGRLAGMYFPVPETTMPADLKKEVFDVLSSELRRQMDARAVDEGDVMDDFEAWRKARRAARSRR